MLKDLGVDISKNTKIDKAALEMRVDASAGRGIAVRREPNTSTEHQSSEQWRDVIAAFVKEALELHCEQKCRKNMKSHPEVKRLTLSRNGNGVGTVLIKRAAMR